MNPLITIHGTWGLSSAQWWWKPDSSWAKQAQHAGLVYADPKDPFLWSGSLGGLGLIARSHDPWMSAGAALCWYCRARNLRAPVIVSHSHGLQVAAYAASFGQTFSALLDISGPVRSDLAGVYTKARPQIGMWWHVYDDHDPILLTGEIGAPGKPHLTLAQADVNLSTSAHGLHPGHTGLLETYVNLWGPLGLWEALLNAARTDETPTPTPGFWRKVLG